jgi:hypothetical protein
MQKLKSNKQADERKDKTMKKNARTDRDTKLRFLETNIFDIAALLPAAHSSYHWQPWVEKMQNIMRKKHEQNKGQRDRSARARAIKRCARALRLAFIQRRSGMWT